MAAGEGGWEGQCEVVDNRWLGRGLSLLIDTLPVFFGYELIYKRCNACTILGLFLTRSDM